MSDFTVKGADDFLALSKRLKAAGEGDLRKALNKGLREAAKPLIGKTRAAARQKLPRRGGLAALVAKEPQRVQVRTGNSAGVRVVVGKSRGAAQAADRGVVRHPVFGRDTFVEQKVDPGWFSETAQDEAPAIRDDVADVLEDFTRRVSG